MAGHDASINTRVSLLTESLLSYFMGSRSKTVKSPTRNAAIYVPQVRGSITSQSDDRSSIGSSTLVSSSESQHLCTDQARIARDLKLSQIPSAVAKKEAFSSTSRQGGSNMSGTKSERAVAKVCWAPPQP